MQRVIYLILLFVLSSSGWGNYTVEMSGEPDYIEFAKKELQGHIARESYYCRGAKFPKLSGEPECKRVGPDSEKCSFSFSCQTVKPGQTRISNSSLYPLSDRGLKSLRKMQVTVNGRKVRFAKKLKAIDGHYEDKNQAMAPVEENTKAQQFKDELVTAGYKSFEELEKSIVERQFERLDVEQNLGDEEILGVELTEEITEKEDLEAELFALREEEITQKELEDKEESEAIAKEKRIAAARARRRKEESKPLVEAEFGIYLLGLSYSLVTTASDVGSVAQSGDIAWSPVLKLSHNWAVRGHFGMHTISSLISETGLEETFSVYDYGLNLEYTLLRQIYADMGLGIQQWNSTEGGSFTTVSFGAGYRFLKSKLWVIDQLFFNYTTVSNTEANRELRFGLRTYF